MKIQNKTIKKLLGEYKEISYLGKIKAILDWDLNVNLPIKASQSRSMHSAYLAEKITEKWLSKEFQTLFEQSQQAKNLNVYEQAIVRNLTRAGKYYYKVPKEIIVEKEKVTSLAFIIWRQAREHNAFKEFLPQLKELVRLDQIIAQHLGFTENPYDALLDQFEPDLTASFYKKTFDKLKPELVSLLKKIQKSKGYKDSTPLVQGTTHYPIPDQKKLAEFVMKKMQYDFQAGRMDESAHPFTTAFDNFDVRVTTKYKDEDFRESFTSCVHETGHAIYEQGIDQSFRDTPLEGGISLGIHEALSRFWENMVGKNPEFIEFLGPLFHAFYPKQLETTNSIELTRAFNLVKPSFIRIEADEVTYSLHIILRFEMENELLNGKIKPEDAEEAWRAKSKEYFGIEPKQASDGILQDVHWAYGAFGYFPSYALGNLYGAQFLHAMKKEVTVTRDLQKGQLGNIYAWLQENVHTYGSLYMPPELLKRATGEPLNPQYFVQYLKEKYSKIYELSNI